MIRPRPAAVRALACALVLLAAGAPPATTAPSARRVFPQDLPLATAGPDSFLATFRTTKGAFTVKAVRAWSPLGVDRLYHLVRGGYYDGVTIYRVGETKSVRGGRVVQFGTSGDTVVSRAWEGVTIDDEPVVRTHRPGALGFARGGPHTRGIELAIATNAVPALDTVRYEGVTGFPVIAEVVQGLDVLGRLEGRWGNGPLESDSLSLLGGAWLDRRFPGLDRIVSATVTRAWGTPGAPVAQRPALAARLDRLLDQPPFDRVTWGVLVTDTAGAVVYARNADRLLVPASNHKLLVAAAALGLLGPDHRVATRVYATGPLDHGVLRGDLVVAGAGDPMFSQHCYGDGTCDSTWTAMDALADTIVARGVRRVAGAVVGDGSAFEPTLTHAAWQQYDLNWWYAAPVSALGFNDNCVDITEAPGPRAGAPATVTFAPDLGLFTFANRSRTTAAGTPRTIEFYREPGTMRLWSEGDLPLGDAPATEHFVLPDPNRYFAAALESRLARRGVRIGAPATSTTDSLRFRDARRGDPLAVHVSRPLGDWVYPILDSSQNWFAEMLLKTLGRERGGAGSWDAGLAVERAFLVDSVGVDASAFWSLDGSGLASANLVTPRALTQVLRYARSHRGAAAFLRALPRAGAHGSLRRRFVGTPLEGRVVAKTGSIDRVHSLSGFIERPDGGPLVFSVIANHYWGGGRATVARIDSLVLEMAR